MPDKYMLFCRAMAHPEKTATYGIAKTGENTGKTRLNMLQIYYGEP
jgi:hypothetical protein